MKSGHGNNRSDVIFVYDGNCPICTYAAHATSIQKNIGDLHLIDARQRSDHPVLVEIKEQNLNLDDGMVLKYQNRYYHGQKALMLMARLGTQENWFNRINRLLFQSEVLSRLAYPIMRGTRNLLLKTLGVEKINNLTEETETTETTEIIAEPKTPTPLFKEIFGKTWPDLPKVFHAHYAPRPGTSDRVRVEGRLDVEISPLVSIMARLTGALIPYSGMDIPVTVTFWCGKDKKSLHFDRAFHYPDHGTYHFRSKMVHLGGNELIEFIKFGVGWRLTYHWDGKKIILKHQGYIWRILGFDLPLPLGIFLGAGYAEETALSDDRFHMWTHAKHPLFGEMLYYSGEFEIKEVRAL